MPGAATEARSWWARGLRAALLVAATLVSLHYASASERAPHSSLGKASATALPEPAAPSRSAPPPPADTSADDAAVPPEPAAPSPSWLPHIDTSADDAAALPEPAAPSPSWLPPPADTSADDAAALPEPAAAPSPSWLPRIDGDRRLTCTPLVPDHAAFMADPRFFAQGNLDMRLRRHLTATHGIYVESGALDGSLFSNTRIFDDLRCWDGILIEPSVMQEEHRVNRPSAKSVRAALVSADYRDAYINGSFSGSATGATGSGMERVRARTLADILREFHVREVDLWSLDVEGFELEALRGVDWATTRITYILVEVWHERTDTTLFDFLFNRSYVVEEDMSQWPKHDPREHRDYLFRLEPDANRRRQLPKHRIGVPASGVSCQGGVGQVPQCPTPPTSGWV